MSQEEKRPESMTEEVLTLLPLCEANRNIVVSPTTYVHNAVFTVGALRLIDKAP